jgi:hypothetical protein
LLRSHIKKSYFLCHYHGLIMQVFYKHSTFKFYYSFYRNNISVK